MVSFILTLKRLLSALYKSLKHPLFLSLITTLFFIILSGVLFYTKKEGWGILDALYFCVISIIPTGVDTNLTPITNLGKVFTMFYLFVGTGVMLLTLLILAKSTINIDDDFKKDFRMGSWKNWTDDEQEEKSSNVPKKK